MQTPFRVLIGGLSVTHIPAANPVKRPTEAEIMTAWRAANDRYSSAVSELVLSEIELDKITARIFMERQLREQHEQHTDTPAGSCGNSTKLIPQE